MKIDDAVGKDKPKPESKAARVYVDDLTAIQDALSDQPGATVADYVHQLLETADNERRKALGHSSTIPGLTAINNVAEELRNLAANLSTQVDTITAYDNVEHDRIGKLLDDAHKAQEATQARNEELEQENAKLQKQVEKLTRELATVNTNFAAATEAFNQLQKLQSEQQKPED